MHPFKKKFHREFWALRDVDLEIPRGATVGILGVNGSGKSTLLQIICSILQPTTGTVEVHGRVAALIELGAGFNPDLTGRENAEINCAIMGLDGRAVRERLPGIEAFADIGEFFDQPVKTYSSGMFMRVAFATAISVDPDILIIDEALAVGDAKFQQKCFRKFRDYQSSGKTILLVTHDRSALPRLCSMGILLNQGHVIKIGDPKNVMDEYSRLLAVGDASVGAVAVSSAATQHLVAHGQTNLEGAAFDFARVFDGRPITVDSCSQNPTYNKNEFRYGLGGAEIIDYVLVSGSRVNHHDIGCGASMDVYLRVRFDQAVEAPIIGVNVKTDEGVLSFGINTEWLRVALKPRARGDVAVYKCTLRMDLGPGNWFLDLAVAQSGTELLHVREGVAHIVITQVWRSIGLASLRTEFSELQ